MINKVIKSAKLGGEQINKFFGDTVQIFNKSTIADFRTEADLASEKAILDELQKHFPDFNYFAEESGWIKNGSEYTF
ncbi:MAG: inositol monophosphatase, partial [Candidatus Magasanikbacteria bacterium]|nr:inositol monophosphatase [Candidatus Magasanikbacteria bacterium]